MDKYSKKPVKNVVRAAIQVVFQSAHNITAPLIARWPQLGLPLSILVTELNFRLLYHQEELNGFVEYLMENLDQENNIDFDSKEFTQALTIAVEQYFKLRLEEKRKIAQRIFLECVKSPNIPQFPLERLNNTLQQISLEGLQYLTFIDKEIMPIREDAIGRKTYMDGQLPASPAETQGERQARYELIEPISPYIEEWLKKYEPPELAHETYAIAEKRERLRQIKRDDLAENAIEMEQLGLMRSHTDSSNTYVGSGPTVFSLTRFGKAFKSFLADRTN